jgi:hypothetical protein
MASLSIVHQLIIIGNTTSTNFDRPAAAARHISSDNRPDIIVLPVHGSRSASASASIHLRATIG